MPLYSTAASGSMRLPAIEAEAWVLSTPEGLDLLADIAGVSAPRPADIAGWRKHAGAEEVAAAIRLAGSRTRAATKYSRADRMWLDPVGLQQATAEAVARHKARRFESDLTVDLCAGIGGDTLALAARGDVMSVDQDHGMCRRIAWNADVYRVGDRVLPCRSSAERFPVPRDTWVHIDPDRRAAGPGRARGVADYAPSLGFLRSLAGRAPAGAIKLSPASDFMEAFPASEFEIELISLDGECKEATVWFGAAATCRKRATRLPEDVTWTDRDGQRSERFRVPVTPVSAFVYDPDPALLRSGLLDSFATAHDLNRIAADVDYLTGDRHIETPFLSAFEVISVHPLDLKRLRRVVAEHDIGPLEIKVRGLDLAPELLRKQLATRGSRPATLILAGGSGHAVAVLAFRIPITDRIRVVLMEKRRSAR
jgi:hypothetical protein